MGKSTSAQILARDHGYVYYEADAFGGMLNPFNPLDSQEWENLHQLKYLQEIM